MSLLKWKEIAKRKTKLSNKINFVHDPILKNQLGEQTDQESFQKMFKPITTKLDDVALGGLRLPTLPRNHGQKCQSLIMVFQHMIKIFLIMDWTIYLMRMEYSQKSINN